ncbi:MAG: D-alanine--D-alanine ligase [Desulfobacterales bacterium]|nr:D-alanine--D-alanine ligase [Desulfobacterales bacterium]
MIIAIVHNTVSESSSIDEKDVLDQVKAVSSALTELGHTYFTLDCSLNLEKIAEALNKKKPDIVFNLVESINGEGRLIHLFPSVLDSLKIPYTGSYTEAVFITSNKILAKEKMASENIPTPLWINSVFHPHYNLPPSRWKGLEKLKKVRWIIKSVWEHASIGIDDESIIDNDDISIIQKIIHKKAKKYGKDFFAEAYIEGREFNISLLETNNGLQILPIAEIIFEGYEANKAKIVDYKAKWDEQSFEYVNTKRCFNTIAQDAPIFSVLSDICKKCWSVFGLKGYARIDLRLDENNQPFVLEVNTNPCLSPDAGFSAALEESGIPFYKAISFII